MLRDAVAVEVGGSFDGWHADAIGGEASHSDMEHSMLGMDHSMMNSMETNHAGAIEHEMSGMYGPYPRRDLFNLVASNELRSATIC